MNTEKNLEQIQTQLEAGFTILNTRAGDLMTMMLKYTNVGPTIGSSEHNIKNQD